MYKLIITNYLTRIGKRYQVKGHEIQCSCLNPNHKDSNPSFSINWKTGLMGCFSCGYKNYIGNLVEEGEIDPEMERTAHYLEYLRRLQEEEEDFPPDISENFLPPDSGIEVKPFRGLSEATIKSNNLYYCNIGRYQGRLIFPMEAGFDARILALDNTPPRVPNAKYLRPVSFKTAQHMYVCKPEEYTDTVIICEGVMDALSFQELGYAAAANFGLAPCTPNKAGELLAHGFTKVVNGFDYDAAGIEGWQKVKESFRLYFEIEKPLGIILDIVESDLGDVNDYLVGLKETDE